jgi:hypothetical protein
VDWRGLKDGLVLEKSIVPVEERTREFRWISQASAVTQNGGITVERRVILFNGGVRCGLAEGKM